MGYVTHIPFKVQDPNKSFDDGTCQTLRNSTIVSNLRLALFRVRPLDVTRSVPGLTVIIDVKQRRIIYDLRNIRD